MLFCNGLRKQRITHLRGNSSVSFVTLTYLACVPLHGGTSVRIPSWSLISGSHRGAVTRRGLCFCLVFGEGMTTRKIGSHSVVLCHIVDYPQVDHSIKTRCGWAGQEPEGHDVTPKPSRKKERKEREIEIGTPLSNPPHTDSDLRLGVFVRIVPARHG